MALSHAASADDLDRPRRDTARAADARPANGSAVSWGAVAAGAAAAASLSLILLILGVGLGLSSVSPWAREGVSATTFGVSTILWVTLTSLLASAMGGYLTGRLRTRWTEVHVDEVYFRDTAHGFLAWAVASLATAALLSSAIGSIVGAGAAAGVRAGSAVVSGMAATAAQTTTGADGPMGYFIDLLFRRVPAGTDTAGSLPAAAPEGRATGPDIAEVARIFANVSLSQPLPADDIRHVGRIVAERTGLSQADAEQRVAAVYARAQTQWRDAEQATRATADKTRKASAYSALWLFVSLLIGAFVASLAATFGGRRRDA
jgi:hypothetical protein